MTKPKKTDPYVNPVYQEEAVEDLAASAIVTVGWCLVVVMLGSICVLIGWIGMAIARGAS